MSADIAGASEAPRRRRRTDSTRPETAAVTDATVRFGRGHGEVTALDGITFAAHAGRVTAVVGGDGAGKSTLLRVLAHRVRLDAGSVRTVPRERIGYQPATSGVWPTLTVDENVDFVGRSYGMPVSRIRVRADELLERAGLDEARRRLGRDLSGGMRQKLGFILAILHDPALVLLDEPSTGVDPVSRLELWRLISATAGEGATVAMATTYLDEAQRAASVLALSGGRMLASGTPDDIIAAVSGPVGRMPMVDNALPADLAARVWRRGTVRHVWSPPGGSAEDPPGIEAIDPPDFEDALIALSLAAGDVAADIHVVDDTPPGRASRRRGTPPSAGAPSAGAGSPDSVGAGNLDSAGAVDPPSGGAGTGRSAEADTRATAPPTASARGVVKRFGHATAVDEVSLDVHPGEIVGLIGANGAGKTTLLRVMLGLEHADGGAVTLFGRAPDNASRRRLGYVPQGLGLYKTLSVRENAAFLSRVYGVPTPALPAALREVRSSVVADIGLGRQRQLAFALALSHRPELLVLDEPTSGVDPLGRARLWDTIHAQADAGRAVIVTTHYLQEAEQCTRLVLLAQGRVVGHGAVADLIGTATAVLVRSDDWQRAFATLDRSGLPIMLSGRDIRVAGQTDATALREAVLAALGDIRADVQAVPATLEETVVLLDSASAPTTTARTASGGGGESGDADSPPEAAVA